MADLHSPADRPADGRDHAGSDGFRGRYERKFVVGLAPAEVAWLLRLHPAGFREIYERRAINNLYFDTPGLCHYRDTADGISERRKLRVRWYGELLPRVASPVLEIKSKRGFVMRKESHPLVPFTLPGDGDPRFGSLRAALEESDLPAALRAELSCLRPTLFNRYQRRYYLSADGRFRVTTDGDLTFVRPSRIRPELIGHWRCRARPIVELKHGLELAEEGAEVASRFPFRLSRSSKYAIGIEALACL